MYSKYYIKVYIFVLIILLLHPDNTFEILNFIFLNQFLF